MDTGKLDPERDESVGDPLIARVVFAIFKALAYFWTILIAALVLSWLGNVVCVIVSDPTSAQRIRAGFWIAGALFAAIGAPLGWISFRVGEPLPQSPEETAEMQSIPQGEGRRCNPAKAGFFAALIGGVLGLILGMLLTLAWLSVGASPFAPKAWADAQVYIRGVPGVSSKSPLAFVLFLGPAVVGAIVPGLAAALLAALGVMRDYAPPGSHGMNLWVAPPRERSDRNGISRM